MQRAARAVAVENSRLRSLLSRQGVSEDEIEKYLASPDEGCQTWRREDASQACSSRRVSTASEVFTENNPSCPSSPGETPADAGTLMCLKRFINKDGPHPFDSLEPHIDGSAPGLLTTKSCPPPKQPGSTVRTELPPLHTLSLSPHQMSRTVAAEAIAGAQGHSDEGLSRTVPGCVDSSSRFIRKTQVSSPPGFTKFMNWGGY